MTEKLKIEVELETLEDYDIVEYVEEVVEEKRPTTFLGSLFKTAKTQTVPSIQKYVFELQLNKNSLDEKKTSKKITEIAMFIIIASIVFGGFLRLLNVSSPERFVLAGFFIALFISIYRNFVVTSISKTNILAYRLGELLQAKRTSLKKITLEPKQFRLLGHLFEYKIREIDKYELRNKLDIHRSALSPVKQAPWLKTFFDYDENEKIFKIKDIVFKVSSKKKLSSSVKNKLEEGLKRLFIARCIIAQR